MAAVDRRGVSVDATDTIIAGDPGPGLAIKAPCLVATTGNPITLIGLQTIDGVALAAGNRVLVKDQLDATTNGIYNASTGIWTRSIDANANSDWTNGTLVPIARGAMNSQAVFQQQAVDQIIVGTSALTFGIVYVPPARKVNTAAPLAGGGSLASDLTLSIAANGITPALIQQQGARTLFGNPTNAPANLAAIVLGSTLAFAGSTLQTAAMTGDVTTSANSFATTIGANAVTNAKLRQSAGLSVVGNSGAAAANVADITGTANQVLVVNSAGTSLAFGQVNLASSAAVNGALAVGNGGTGLASLTANAVYKGNSTSALAASSITDDGTTFAINNNKFTVAVASGNCITQGSVTCAVLVSSNEVRAGGNLGGGAGTNSLTGTASTTISTGTGTVKMSDASSANNAGWILLLNGTSNAWVPYWSTNAP